MSEAPRAKPAGHPSYKEMISKAIAEVKDRKGASRQAIVKHIVANHSIENVGVNVRKAIKRGIVAGTFVLAEGVGANGRYKLPKEEKKPKPAAKKPAAKKTATKAKKPAAKRPAAKKAGARKATPKKKTAAKKPATKKPATKKAASTTKATTKKPSVKKGTTTKTKSSPKKAKRSPKKATK